jgi:hypothetical protein
VGGGVGVNVVGIVQTTGNGDIDITGTGGSGGIGGNAGLFVHGSLVSALGTGDVRLIGTGGSGPQYNHGIDLVGSIGPGTNVKVNGGELTLDGTAGGGSDSVALRLWGTAGASNTVRSTGAGNITLIGDSLSIEDTNTIDAAGSATLRPRTAGTAIDLGGVDAAGVLGLTDAELDRVTAGTLHIGSRSAGAITVSAAVDPAGTDRLHLRTGGWVRDINNAGITETELAITAGGTVVLTASDADALAAAVTGSGGIVFADPDGLTVGVLDGVTGLRTPSGNLVVTAGGPLTMSQALDTAGGSLDLYVLADDAALSVNAPLSATANALLSADRMAINAPVSAPGQSVTLLPDYTADTGDAIDLGSATDTAPATLELSDAELDRITAATIRIGDPGTGPITITAPITANVTTLHLVTGSGIGYGPGGSLEVTQLALEAKKAVALKKDAGSYTKVEYLAYKMEPEPTAPLAEKKLAVENTGPMTITEVDGVSGGKSTGVVVEIITHSPLTIDRPVIDTAGGTIRLVATNDGGGDDHLTINATVQTSGGDGNIELVAGTDLTVTDTGSNQVSVPGGGSITAAVQRTTHLDVGVGLNTAGGAVTISTTNLTVQGTAGDDSISFTPGPGAGQVAVTVGGVPRGTFAIPAAGQITASGGAGDDSISVAATITNPVTLSGGDGADVLQGGGGANQLIGGSGGDVLLGGGAGSTNTLDGGDGDDTLQDRGGTNTVVGAPGATRSCPAAGRTRSRRVRRVVLPVRRGVRPVGRVRDRRRVDQLPGRGLRRRPGPDRQGALRVRREVQAGGVHPDRPDRVPVQGRQLRLPEHQLRLAGGGRAPGPVQGDRDGQRVRQLRVHPERNRREGQRRGRGG